MVMENIRILVTGQYWHQDFRELVSSSAIVTLCPQEKATDLCGDQEFELIVIAQARREAVSIEVVEHLQNTYATTPIVALLGSWCEGESRSGTPWAGIPRIYWHQWNGEFAQFQSHLKQRKLHDWQLPRTAQVADRIAAAEPDMAEVSFPGIVGVSAWTQTQYSMLSDALQSMGIKTCWIERCTWDGEARDLVKAIVLDDDSMTSNLGNRIRWVFSLFGRRPLVLTLGFPRKDEVDALKELGVSVVVSKPFKLDGLKQALMQATKSCSPQGAEADIAAHTN